MNLGRFWTELGQLFDKISRDGGVRAVVLASAFPKVFTAGLDCTFTSISLPHTHIQPSFYHSNRRRRPLLLPFLSFLSIRHITYITPVARRGDSLLLLNGVPDAGRMPSSPALSHLRVCFEPEVVSVATSEVVTWLGNGPSYKTLKSLIIPPASISPQAVLRHFGSSVIHLALPLRTLESE